MKSTPYRTAGYSLLELLVGTVLFTIICGSVFSVLSTSQLTYQGESTAAAAFQQANVAIDQMVRDIHSAGYPPASSFNLTVAQGHPENVAVPFSWMPGYTNVPAVPCIAGLGATCTMPGPNDLILEAADSSGAVQWIRYSLQGTTLMRASKGKAPFRDPVASTDGDLVPYLDNVVNPAGQPIFSYIIDDGTPSGALSGPVTNIRKVDIQLVVQSSQRDAQTGQFHTITVTGQAVRFNPNQ